MSSRYSNLDTTSLSSWYVPNAEVRVAMSSAVRSERCPGALRPARGPLRCRLNRQHQPTLLVHRRLDPGTARTATPPPKGIRPPTFEPDLFRARFTLLRRADQLSDGHHKHLDGCISALERGREHNHHPATKYENWLRCHQPHQSSPSPI